MGATVEVNGTAVDADGTAAVDLDVGMNTITAMVTAQDGETMMTYTITVTRAASMDASLSALSLMDGDTEITLAMVADMPMKRTASVGNDVESVTVTATPNDMENAMAVIMPADADMDMDGHQVALMVGANEITVTVTAQDGETMMTYTITVTRAASMDASLSALSLMDGDTEIDLAMVADMPMKRTASVGNDVESVTVTATPNDMENAMAVIMPADADMDMDGHQVDLMVGDTEITVTVTAQDGTTMMTYMVTVTRAAPADPLLDKYDADDDGSFSREEVEQAITRYFNNEAGVTQDDVIAVITRYLAGS
jgi:azurin